MNQKKDFILEVMEQEREKEYTIVPKKHKNISIILNQKIIIYNQISKNILKAYQVSARTLSQARKNFLKETLNEHVFEKIDTPDKAYWLGVMYSDGYISKANSYTNYFGLSVSSKDKDWF